MAFDWQGLIGGIASGIAGDPGFIPRIRLAQQQQQMKMQMFLESLKQQQEQMQMAKEKHQSDMELHKWIVKETERKFKAGEFEDMPLEDVAPQSSISTEGIPPEGQAAALEGSIPTKDNYPKWLGKMPIRDVKSMAPILTWLKGEKPAEHVIPAGAGLARDGKIVAEMPKATPEKPVNVPPWMDALGLEMFGENYHSAQGQKEFASWYKQAMSDPKTRKAVEKFQTEYTLRNTPQTIQMIQTDQGFVPFVSKGQGVGSVGGPTGLNKPETSEMITAGQQIGTLKDTLDRIKANYKPDYVGPFEGRAGGLKERWLGVPEGQGMFYSDLAQAKNTLIYLYSGKQINENEYKRLLDQLPTRELPTSTFETRMKGFEETLNSIIKHRQEHMGGYGKETPKSSANKAESSTPTVSKSNKPLNERSQDIMKQISARFRELDKNGVKDEEIEKIMMKEFGREMLNRWANE